MRVAIAGAGAVGRSVAQTLVAAGHQVLLIEHRRPNYQPKLVPDADWMLADACEVEALRAAGLPSCDVVVAATGDDKANLVFSLLAKSEFAVAQVVARVNHPDNQWLFSEAWGVDFAVSTPRKLAATVEEAVIVGEVVQLMSLRHGQVSLVEITLPENSRLAGTRLAELTLPLGATMLAVVRGEAVLAPEPGCTLHPRDELVLLASAAAEERVRSVLCATA